jgi:hypothetical protein
VIGGDAMANPDIDGERLRKALIGSRSAIRAYLKAIADPRIIAKLDLCDFSLSEQVDALSYAKTLRESGMPVSEVVGEIARVFGFEHTVADSLIRKGSGYEKARREFGRQRSLRAKAELDSPHAGGIPPTARVEKRGDAP